VPGGTDNVEAWDLMLRARSLVRRRNEGDPGRAAGLLKQAIALDPRFALAWNVLGNALTSLLTFNPEDPAAVRREIDAALERSVTLAPDLWTGHEARANQLELRHDWIGAEQANARSRALAPKSMREPIISRAHQLAILGRVNDAIPYFREAIRVEPFAPAQSLHLALDIAGRHDEAELEYVRNIERPGNHLASYLFGLWGAMGIRDHALARERLALCVADATGARSSFFRTMLDVFDDPAQARLALQRRADAAAIDADIHEISVFAAYFGAPELALASWRPDARGLIGVFLIGIWHPVHAQMRALPGFKTLVRDLGYLGYWRTTGQWGDFARPLGEDDFECW
jgi:tetratricopeptide (TPR) repeat protein